MPSRDSRVAAPDRSPRQTVVDEWGIYDPSQAGLEALFERLDSKEPAVDEIEAAAIASSMRDANTLTKR